MRGPLRSRIPACWRLALIVLVGVAIGAERWCVRGTTARDSSAVVERGDRAVEEAFRERATDRWLGLEGRVERLLPDDREGSRHQRFVVRLDSGLTVLVAHNIDLAPRAPIEIGERVTIFGQYEWNERGGVVHWTHHDPDGEHPGGWIEVRGQRYR